MKNIKIYLLICLILPALTYIGCDDAGVILPFVAKGKVGVNQTGLKILNPNIDGMYEVWLELDSAGNTSWASCGRFNVTSTGATVDINGNPAVFQYTGDTTKLGFAKKILLTVERGNGIIPGPQVLLSGTVTVTADSVYGNMDLSGADAFGDLAVKLKQNTPGKYIRWSPTTNNANSTQGIWLCDSNGVSYMPDGISLPTGGNWIYQAWLVDNTTNTYRSMGRFFDPKGADDDLAGRCSGPGAGFNAPGQDWIQTGGACGDAVNVVCGCCGILITMEPVSEVPGSLEGNTPSFFKVFSQNIDPSLGSGQLDYIYSVYVVDAMPKVSIKITN